VRRRDWIVVAALGSVLIFGGGAAGMCKAKLDCRGLVGITHDDRDPPPVVVEGGADFEEGFVERAVVQGLVEPTDFAFLPDGRVLVSEKPGLIRIASGGKLARRPVLDLRDSISTANLRGILTVQVDPEFARRPFIYVLRTLKVGPSEAAPTSARLSRFTLGDSVVRPDSEVVLLGTEGGGRSCLELPAMADCLPADSQHIGGQIRFSGDGTLYVSTGDGGGSSSGFDVISERAQDVNSLGGKVLRITRTGAGVPTNPYWNGNPGANRSKVWASGLRNPFRWTFRPGSREVFVADLGSRAFDEISVVGRGSNLGWPCYEGATRFEPYEEAGVCVALYGKGPTAVRFPVVAFPQGEARSLIGGVFYTGRAYPGRYAGTYFFADFIYGWMKLLRFGDDGLPLGDAEPFGSGLSGPVAIEQGPDGRLYYLSYVTGELRRIDYKG
jgi:glucose/arabinose dehydrogenase